MNSLTGNIVQIEEADQLMLVHVDIGERILKSIVLETQASAPHLQIGNSIQVLFKETEVVISKEIDRHERVSLQNRIPCVLVQLDTGKLLSRLVLGYQDAQITSVITTHAVNQLGLAIGDKLLALVKTNELMLAR